MNKNPGGKKVKKLGLIMILSIIMVSLTGIVSASSFDVGVNPIEVTAKQGESLEVKVNLKDIDMKRKRNKYIRRIYKFWSRVIENVRSRNKKWLANRI